MEHWAGQWQNQNQKSFFFLGHFRPEKQELSEKSFLLNFRNCLIRFAFQQGRVSVAVHFEAVHSGYPFPGVPRGSEPWNSHLSVMT